MILEKELVLLIVWRKDEFRQMILEKELVLLGVSPNGELPPLARKKPPAPPVFPKNEAVVRNCGT
jgi:hypothetical protein